MLQPKEKHAVAEKLSAKPEKAPKEVASPSKPKNDVQAKAPLKELAKAKAVVPTANENNGNPSSSVPEEPVSMSKVVTKAKAVALKTTAKKGISANLKDDPPELVSVGVLRAAQGPLDAFFPELLDDETNQKDNTSRGAKVAAPAVASQPKKGPNADSAEAFPTLGVRLQLVEDKEKKAATTDIPQTDAQAADAGKKKKGREKKVLMAFG